MISDTLPIGESEYRTDFWGSAESWGLLLFRHGSARPCSTAELGPPPPPHTPQESVRIKHHINFQFFPLILVESIIFHFFLLAPSATEISRAVSPLALSTSRDPGSLRFCLTVFSFVREPRPNIVFYFPNFRLAIASSARVPERPPAPSTCPPASSSTPRSDPEDRPRPPTEEERQLGPVKDHRRRSIAVG